MDDINPHVWHVCGPECVETAPVNAPADIYKVIAKHLGAVEVEHFVVVVLDVRNRPLRIETIGKGSVDKCHVDPRDVFRIAIRENGCAVIVAHNHPSGDPSPSPDDVTLTRKLVRCGEILGMPVLDHIILATGRFAKANKRYVSMADIGICQKENEDV